MRKAYKDKLDELDKLLESICTIKAPVEEYIECLEEAQTKVESFLEAGQEDLRREEGA